MKLPKKQNIKYNRELIRGFSVLSQLGLTMAVCIFLGVFMGKFLDGVLGASPLFLFIFSLLGAAAAFKVMFDFLKV